MKKAVKMHSQSYFRSFFGNLTVEINPIIIGEHPKSSVLELS